MDTGQRASSTEAQRHFVAVCRCEGKAQTAHEIGYLKHRMLVNQQRGEVLRPAEDIDEFGDGVPKPGWFSDDGWKRMRGRYLSNSD
jgi:uncharacterized protein YifE (UPF0438 family)